MWARVDSNHGPCHYLPRTKFWVVGDDGVEPSTSSLSEKRSTAELVTQNFSIGVSDPVVQRS